MTRPFVLGLTGSIGMGKSTVAAILRDLGVPVFDADAEVHRLQGPDGALLGAIEAAFPGTTGPAGVDRAKLGAAVFGDAAALARLEAIVHPAVAEARAAFLAGQRAAPLVVFDIPLLFEKDGWQDCDRIMVVTAPLFFAVIAGPVGAMVYRAVNTLDSMFGHLDDRYRDFGWAAARMPFM